MVCLLITICDGSIKSYIKLQTVCTLVVNMPNAWQNPEVSGNLLLL
jgi:hypothetical protein